MKKRKKYEFIRGIYTENELKNAISVLVDIESGYKLFDAEDYPKRCACRIAIDALRTIVGASASGTIKAVMGVREDE